MSFLRRLFGAPPQPREVEATLVKPARDDAVLEIVGESNYQDALLAISGGRTSDGPVKPHGHLALLWPEPKNRYDPNAVSIRIEGRVVGYLSREEAVRWSRVLAAATTANTYVAAEARLIGGWDRGNGDRGTVGVQLHLGSPFETYLELLDDAEQPAVHRNHPWVDWLVAVTGDTRCTWRGHAVDREGLVHIADRAGIRVHPRVTKQVQLLIDCDPASVSGNEAKANTYGIPVISDREFFEQIGFDVAYVGPWGQA